MILLVAPENIELRVEMVAPAIESRLGLVNGPT